MGKNGEGYCISQYLFAYLPTKYTIVMRDFVPNKKEHKSGYFKIINSEVKAYILGCYSVLKKKKG